MSTNLEHAVNRYVRAEGLSQGTRDEYVSTLRKWTRWGGDISINELTRTNIREFLDCEPVHEPLRWRQILWNPQSPEGQAKERSRWGWIVYRRVKTGKTFCRPMNRVVHMHLKSVIWMSHDRMIWSCRAGSSVRMFNSAVCVNWPASHRRRMW